jgi:diguanylate cyclase (GGDEF)-like protein
MQILEKAKTNLPDFLQHHLKSCRSLPSAPAVVIHILELSREEEVSISKIAQVISRDPALAAKLLRVANSAFYGIRYEVTTLTRAISVLGINPTLSLALSFSLVRHLQKSDNKSFDVIAYWRRSAIAAAAGRALGELLNKSMREEFYLSGLLQDIGMLVLNEAIPHSYNPLVAAAKGSHKKLIEMEREKLGVDHSAVGAWLLELWNLPEKYQFAVKTSHDPKIIAESDDDIFCQATSVAGDFAEIWMDPATATSVAHDSATGLLKIAPEKFETLLGAVASAIPAVTSELDIDICSEEKTRQLLEQAHEALVVLTMQAQQQVQQIRDLSRRDRLTAVYNRSYLEEELPRQFEAASRSEKPLSVLFIDIDYFKRVNDTYGHEAGDVALVFTASAISASVRASDIIARYGGEEFVCLLPNTDARHAAIIGEQIRVNIASKAVGDDTSIRVTVSIGGATHSMQRQFDGPKQLLGEADRCLYIAKAKGRNRFMMAEPTAEASNLEGCA